MKAKHIILIIIILIVIFRRRAVVVSTDNNYKQLLIDQDKRYTSLVADFETNQIFHTSTINELTFPMKRAGFILASLDINFSDTPKKQLYYNDGSALTKADLYAVPFDKVSNLI
ncbi:hypothetical protein [Dyadobacter psychrotolerans]|uniref:Uncharacterized protein n=1 Tax=Dyadobacter psychrotolerans TaxID=2541721 RepID=A0A4V2Z457_9BACT|nr:hypothetical protein [Dyadobacter psychrotolerans]TDE15298.1 hypothetical protein E0F88_12300 [Dyadobacter psychrotolerans]